MTLRLCPVTGKRQYVNAARAQKVIAAAARRARDNGVVAVPMAAYRCLHCDRWHLTHYTPRETRDFRDRDAVLRASRKNATRKQR